MKTTNTLIAAVSALAFTLVSCGEKKNTETKNADPHQDHSNCDHDAEESAVKADKEDDHEGHDHAKKVAGPNGGRIMTNIEPHAEFWVTPERKVRITFLDEGNKAIAVTEQSINVFCGNRNAPTKLSFTKEADGMSMISSAMIPEGSEFDTNVTFKMTADAKRITAKFNLNMNDCPNCDYKEYACTCVHAH